MKKYKVWLHLEEITLDEDGEEEEYMSMDEEVLPLPVAEVDTQEDAERFMNELYNAYYRNK
jgi:SepF-like predicted cell division protein (DUF552 family)